MLLRNKVKANRQYKVKKVEFEYLKICSKLEDPCGAQLISNTRTLLWKCLEVGGKKMGNFEHKNNNIFWQCILIN